MRRRALRAHRPAGIRVLLPLHAVPAAHRHGCGDQRPARVGLVPRDPRGRADRPTTGPTRGFEKAFHSSCGSALFSRNPDDHDQMAVRMGAFDGDPGVRPSFRQVVAYAAPWEPIPDDGLPRYPERPPA